MIQYVLCAATSPAVKQQEETLTYLNQGVMGLGMEGASGRLDPGWAGGGRQPLCPPERGAHFLSISPRPVL